MNENRRQILEMLAAGKITADQAERLLAALDPPPTAKPETGSSNVRFEGFERLLDTVVGHGTRLVVTAASVGSNKVGGIV